MGLGLAQGWIKKITLEQKLFGNDQGTMVSWNKYSPLLRLDTNSTKENRRHEISQRKRLQFKTFYRFFYLCTRRSSAFQLTEELLRSSDCYKTSEWRYVDKGSSFSPVTEKTQDPCIQDGRLQPQMDVCNADKSFPERSKRTGYWEPSFGSCFSLVLQLLLVHVPQKKTTRKNSTRRDSRLPTSFATVGRKVYRWP